MRFTLPLTSVPAGRMFKLRKATLEQEYFPRDWKVTTLMAIHKVGLGSDYENCRPVSLECALCKKLGCIIWEHCIHIWCKNTFCTLLNMDFWNGDLSNNSTTHFKRSNWQNSWSYSGRSNLSIIQWSICPLLLKLWTFGMDDRRLTWVGEFLISSQEDKVKRRNGYQWSASGPETRATAAFAVRKLLGRGFSVFYLFIL